MTLTLSHGPLAREPRTTRNFAVDGPRGRLLLEPFPRRIRTVLAGTTVLDSVRAALLHETAHLPQLYVPEADLRADLLAPSDTVTRCPWKGEAAYRALVVGERTAPDAVWTYPDPNPEAAFLTGLCGVEWRAVDTWLDEDEPVLGHLTDPYHRVDCRASSRHVRVEAVGEVLAETRRPVVLSETGLPNRLYVPLADVRAALLPSATATVCPYKGVAAYHGVELAGGTLEDVAWGYPEPLGEAHRIADHVCFLADGVTTTVDGAVADG